MCIFARVDNLTKNSLHGGMMVIRKQVPSEFAYTINSTLLERFTRQKYTGVTSTSELRWDAHINNVRAAALRSCFFLRRLLPLAPTQTGLLTYTTFVLPILEHANNVWFLQSVTQIAKLEHVQRKAVRFIHKKY